MSALGAAILKALDGDTFQSADGQRTRVAGMDTPEVAHAPGETDQVGGRLATRFLQNELNTKQVAVEPTGEQSYDRQVARVSVNGQDLAQRMISLGLGRPTFHSTDDQKRAEEQKLIRSVVPSMSTPEERAVDAALGAERAKRPFTPDLASVQPISQRENNAFVDSMQRGTDTMHAGLYGFAQLSGQMTGFDALKAMGEEGVRRNMIEAAQNPARIESIDDIETLGQLGMYVLEAVGENTPNIAMLAAGGGSGALLARAAVGKAALSTIKRGALAGATAADYPLQTGESYTNLLEEGIDAPGTSLVAGAGKTALDIFGVERIVSTAFKGLDKGMAADLVNQVAKAGGLKGTLKLAAGIGKEAGKGAGVGLLVEGPTEGMQEAIDIAAQAYHDPKFDPTGPEAIKRIKEAAAKGAAAGGAMGGAGRGTTGGANIIRQYLAGQDAQKGKEDNQIENVVPETQAQIDAQAAAVADPTSDKQTLLVTPGSPEPSTPVPGATEVETPLGKVITKDEAVIAAPPQTEAEMGKALYGAAGEQGKPADADRAVVAQDAQGRPVAEIAAGPSTLEAARAEAQAQAPEGGRVVERDPREVLAERIPQESKPTDTKKLSPEEEAELAEMLRSVFKKEQLEGKTNKQIAEDAVAATEHQAEVLSSTRQEQPNLGHRDEDTGALEEAEVSADPAATKDNAAWETTLKAGIDLPAEKNPQYRTGKLETAVRKLKHMIPGLEAAVDKEAGTVTLKAPLDSPALRDVETGASVYDALVKSVLEGERGQTMRTEWTHPEILSQSEKTKGKPVQIRMNTQALAYLGAALRGRSITERPTPAQVRDDLLTAFGWMLDKGYEPQGYQKKKFKAKPGPKGEPKKSGPGAYTERGAEFFLPDDAVVYAPNAKDKWTWGYLTKDLKRRTDALWNRVYATEAELKEGNLSPEEYGDLRTKLRTQLDALRELGETVETGREEFSGADASGEVSDPKSYDPSVQTEAEQARAQKKEASGAIKYQPKHGGEAGSVSGSKAMQKLAATANHILALAGFNNLSVNYADTSGLSKFENDPRYKDAVAQLRKDKPTARIIFPNGETGAARMPLIYISDGVFKLNAPQQAYIMGHELGHLLQVAHLDQAPKATQDAVRAALGPENFKENFANEVAKWVVTHREPRGVVENFFRELVKKFRTLWQALRRTLKLNQTFSDYMDAVLAVGLVRAGKEPEPSPLTEYGKRVHEFIAMPRGPFLPPVKTPQEWADFNFADMPAAFGEGGKRGLQRALGEKKAQDVIEWGKNWAKSAKGVMRWGYEILLQSEIGHLQSLAKQAPRLKQLMVDTFHHTPGTETTNKKGTFYQRLNMEGAPHLNKLLEIAERLFPYEPGWLARTFGGKETDAKKAAEYKAAFEELRKSQPNLTSPIAKELRQWMREVYDWALGKGAPLDFAPEDFPAHFNVDKVAKEKEKVIQALRGAGYSVTDAQMYYEILSRHYPPFHFVRRSNVLENVPSPEEYEGRGHLPVKVADALAEYISDNLFETMAGYLHAMNRRGVMHEMFGLSPKERSQEYVRNIYEAAGIGPRDPLAKLKFELQELSATGELPAAEYDRILTHTIPNLLGRQNAKLSPVARRAMSVVMLWQNYAKMSLSVLSSLMDFGVIAWKSRAPVRSLELTLKALLSKRTREQLVGDAKMLGAVRDGYAAHVLADIGVAEAYLSDWTKKWNDKLFHWNGLEFLTSLSRGVSLSLGREAMKRWATSQDPVDIKALELLGTTQKAVLAWMEAGEPMDRGHESARAALFQWVDESVVRPTAAMRPEWGNNASLMLIWHLKSWMWGYHETVLRQAWNDARGREGLKKALPFVALAALTIPFAALGYELRGLITKRDKDFEKSLDKGIGEYAWEVMQRAGAFGILQLYVDMEEAKDYGRLAIVSALGPTASSVEDYFRKDLDYFFMKSLPGAALIQGIQRRISGEEH